MSSPPYAGKHGASAYRGRGCRCAVCRRGNTDRGRNERAARKALLAADPTLAPHGHRSTYQNWGCRCPACRQAQSEACAEERRRRQAREEVARD